MEIKTAQRALETAKLASRWQISRAVGYLTSLNGLLKNPKVSSVEKTRSKSPAVHVFSVFWRHRRRAWGTLKGSSQTSRCREGVPVGLQGRFEGLASAFSPSSRRASAPFFAVLWRSAHARRGRSGRGRAALRPVNSRLLCAWASANGAIRARQRARKPPKTPDPAASQLTSAEIALPHGIW